MKTFKFLATAMVVAAALCACGKESPTAYESPVQQQEVIITASLADGPATKTIRQDDGKVFWSPADEISIFYGSGTNGGSKFTSLNEEPVQLTNFTGSIGVITGGNEVSTDQTYFWGLYPYDPEASCDAASVTTTLAARQTGVAGTFEDDTFITLGRSQGLNLSFFNVCGGIKFSVSQAGIKRVTFRGNNGEALGGKVKIAFGTDGYPYIAEVLEPQTEMTLVAPDGEFEVGAYYHLVTLPATLSAGFTMEFIKDTEKGTRATTSSTTINRGKFGTMTNADTKATFIGAIDFEDPLFKAYCVSSFDADGNGELSLAEAADITVISCVYQPVTSMAEVKYMPALDNLICINDNLTSLDLSANTALVQLICYSNQLTSLNLTGCSSLSTVMCNSNQLTSLDLSSNTALINLLCYDNRLTSLNLSANTALEGLSCSSNQLTGLDVSANTALKTLSCFTNKLTDLDVRANTALETLNCAVNQLTSLDVSTNIALQSLSCQENQLTSLDVSANSALTSLDCSPMHDADGYNVLSKLYLASGQVLANINDPDAPRNNEFVPEETEIIIKGEAGGSEGTGDENWDDEKSSFVDLGLTSGLKWATCNLGATKPEEYGDYYAWGETEPYYVDGDAQKASPTWKSGKTGYDWSSYRWCNGTETTLTKYCASTDYGTVDSKTVLESTDDAAHVKLGGSWRMPTDAEWTELRTECDWSDLITDYKGTGVAGRLVTSKTNGKSIFLPAAGGRIDARLDDTGTDGYYWSSTLSLSGSGSAHFVIFNSGGVYRGSYRRYNGHSVRPVTE